MTTRYYKEINRPKKKGLLKKVSEYIGNRNKPKYEFDTSEEIPSLKIDSETYEVDAGYYNPFEGNGKDELRKKKTTKAKTKRKPCKCK